MGTATTSISGTLDKKMNASPECIANRGALFLCHLFPPVGPCAAPCRGLRGWVGKALTPHRRRPCRASVEPMWASLRITGFEEGLARSKRKQEKGGGVAIHPTSGSQRPAMPVVSRDSGLSRAQDKVGLLISQFPENRVVVPIIGCITANIQGLL